MSAFDIVTISVAASASLFTLMLWLNGRKGIRNETYLKLLEQYSTPDMLIAAQSLNNLLEKCKRDNLDITAVYAEHKKNDDTDYENADPRDKPFILSNSINNHRRMISHFYYRLLCVVETNVVPANYIFRYWGSKSLHLIPNALAKLGYDSDKRLEDLLLRAKRYERTRTRNTLLIVVWFACVLILDAIALWITRTAI